MEDRRTTQVNVGDEYWAARIVYYEIVDRVVSYQQTVGIYLFDSRQDYNDELARIKQHHRFSYAQAAPRMVKGR